MARKILADPDYILRAWAAILIVAAIDLIWAEHAGLKITGIGLAVPAVAMIAAVGFFFDYLGRTPQIAEAAHYCALWIAFGVTLAIYSYVVATLRMPMCDLQFARMDAALGFNWAAGFDAVMSSRWIFRYLLSHAYNSIYFQVFASIGYFAMIEAHRPNAGTVLDRNLVGLHYFHAGRAFPGARSFCQWRYSVMLGGTGFHPRWQRDAIRAARLDWNRGFSFIPHGAGSPTHICT